MAIFLERDQREEGKRRMGRKKENRKEGEKTGKFVFKNNNNNMNRWGQAVPSRKEIGHDLLGVEAGYSFCNCLEKICGLPAINLFQRKTLFCTCINNPVLKPICTPLMYEALYLY